MQGEALKGSKTTDNGMEMFWRGNGNRLAVLGTGLHSAQLSFDASREAVAVWESRTIATTVRDYSREPIIRKSAQSQYLHQVE
jgi:hypothetical protein